MRMDKGKHPMEGDHGQHRKGAASYFKGISPKPEIHYFSIQHGEQHSRS